MQRKRRAIISTCSMLHFFLITTAVVTAVGGTNDAERLYVWKISKGDKVIVPNGAFTVDGSWPGNHFSDFPVSIPALLRLVVEERKFYMMLKDQRFRGVSSEGHNLIFRYTRRYEIEVIDAVSRWARISKQRLNYLAILDHPFLIFQMLRRLVYEFPKLYSVLNSTAQGLPNFDPDVSRWPEENDVYFYGSLIVVLHHFYDFHISKFGRGMFGRLVTGVNLSAVHAMELSRFAEKQNCFTSAVDFSAFAYDQAHRVGGIPLKDALEAYKRAVAKHDEEMGLFTHTSNYGFFLTPIVSISNFTFNRPKFIRRKTVMQEQCKRRFPRRIGTDGELEEMDSHNFMTFCKGENLQAPSEKKELHCYYKVITGICPYRVEVLSITPKIVLIHGFIGNRDSEVLQDCAFPRLTVVKAPETEQRKRVATACSVGNDCPHPTLLEKLELRAERLTNLKIRGSDSSEPFYITLNGPGGVFRPQLDSVGKYYSQKGHYRLATLQIYLNKVEAGGRTAFHQIGLASRPEGGSALFWFNHYKNGTLIDNMIHGGCPVVLGHKWVATKWILGPGNFHTYKCAPNRSE